MKLIQTVAKTLKKPDFFKQAKDTNRHFPKEDSQMPTAIQEGGAQHH